MAAPKVRNLQSEITCSICLELVNGPHERSVAKLICGHTFHLDCIGSAFNSKGSMQCPNCRRMENGNWLYGNGRPPPENSTLHDVMLDEEYNVELEMLARVSDLVVPYDIWQCRWCPYQEMHAHLAMPPGNENHHGIPYAEVVLSVLVDEALESNRSVQPPSPYARAPAPVELERRTRGIERSVEGPVSSLAHMHHGAAYQQHFSPVEQRGRRRRQSSAAVERDGVVGSVSVEEGSAGQGWHSQSRHDGVRRRLSASASEFLPRPESRHRSSTTSALQEPVRELQPRSTPSFGLRRRVRTSRLGQNPSEPEGQMLAPSIPSIGLHNTHGVSAAYLPAPSHARHHHPSAEDIDVHPSRSFHHPR